MSTQPTATVETASATDSPSVRVNGDLINLNDHSPSGRQILAAAGLRPPSNFALLHWPVQGPTNEIGLDEILKLPKAEGPLEFLAIEDDGVSYFMLDEARYAWAGPLDETTLRRVGRVADNMELWLERIDHPDRQLEAGEAVKLGRAGVERFYTRKRVWKLEVQGELTKWDYPQVLVRDALVKAGIDPGKSWVIMLKVKDQPVRQVEQTDTIDLSQPGIERLRVRPKHVDNGDGQTQARRDFSLLPKDAQFLDASGFQWQTVNDATRWLIVENYSLPAGYNAPTCRLAIIIPPDYPTAQLDMFFCSPVLTANGAAPANTEVRQTIDGVEFQRWSRHRGPGCSWSPATDNLATHFALIEHAIYREVGV